MLARGSKRGSTEASMPSTRGIGSKIMCCCSLALFAAISCKLISPNASRVRCSGQRTVASSMMSPSWANCTATRNRTGSLPIRSLISSKRKFGLPAAADAVRISKPECGYREERLLCKAGRYWLGNLHKCQSRGMRTEELLDGIRVRPFRVGGNHGIQELHESLGGAHREIVDRMTDDVGVDMLGEMEADRKTAWARALRVVVG